MIKLMTPDEAKLSMELAETKDRIKDLEKEVLAQKELVATYKGGYEKGEERIKELKEQEEVNNDVKDNMLKRISELEEADGLHQRTLEREAKLEKRVEVLEAYLRIITKGMGPFNRDTHVHAHNVIEAMKSRAAHALDPDAIMPEED